MSSSEMIARTTIAPCRNRAGLSTEMAPPAVIALASVTSLARSAIATSAPTSASRPMASWVMLRAARCTNASTITPKHAAPKRISIGSSAT
jgi:hypothetical protein